MSVDQVAADSHGAPGPNHWERHLQDHISYSTVKNRTILDKDKHEGISTASITASMLVTYVAQIVYSMLSSSDIEVRPNDHLQIPQSLGAAGVEQEVLTGQVQADVVDILGRSTCRSGCRVQERNGGFV